MSNQLQISGAAKIRSIQGPVVANSGVITALDGDASQYVRGDGTLADFPTSTGGGSSVSYYLNTSVSQGTIGGVAYKQLSKVPIAGAGTDVSISANGYIASYITDANDPALLEVPAGNFNCEFYFSVNSNAHNPYVYAEVYKYDGTTFTLLGSSQSVPEYLTNGTTLSPYYFAIPVATSVLTITDRIAVRIFVNVDGRTVTLHTENNHLCQIVTTFSKGLTTLNSLTRQVQFFQTGTSGSDFNISSVTATHTFNIPDASATNRGLITTGTQTIAGDKTLNGNTDFVGNSNFSGYAIFSNAIPTQINYGAKIAKGLIPATFGSDSVNLYSDATTNNIIFRDNLSIAKLLFNNSTQTFTFPAASGTIALTSNLSSYVPYTGATASVDLGIYNLTANNVFGETSLNVKVLPSGSVYSTGYATLSSLAGKFTMAQEATAGNLKAFTFDFSAWASNSSYTYTLPSATGTLALTSNLSSYVPYTGATGGVDIGIYNLSSNALIVNGTVAAGGCLNLKQNATTVATGIGYNSIGAKSANSLQIYYGGATVSDYKTILLNVTNLTNTSTRTFEFPDASGTIALGTGTTNYVSKFTGTNTIGNSLIFDNGTNVGIGNTNTSYTLDVSGTGRFTSTLLVGGAATFSSTLTTTGIGINYTGALAAKLHITVAPSTSYAPAIALRDFDNPTYGFTFKLDTAVNGDMRIDRVNAGVDAAVMSFQRSTGNVGIGTVSPTRLLDVNGVIRTQNSGSAGAPSIELGTSAKGNGLFYPETNTIAISTSDTERMRVSSGGSVIVQSVRNNTFASSGNLQLFDNTNNIGWGFQNNTFNNLVVFSYNGVWNTVGYFTNGTGVYVALSDANKKKDFEDSTIGLKEVLQLKPTLYRMKSEDETTDKHLGFIAQEVKDLIPQAYNQNGQDGDDDIFIGLTEMPIIAALTKAIQEQQALITSLQARLDNAGL
jgi:hypothetical protein